MIYATFNRTYNLSCVTIALVRVHGLVKSDHIESKQRFSFLLLVFIDGKCLMAQDKANLRQKAL